MQTEPQYRQDSATLGDNCTLTFKGENWGDGFKDTEVKIGDRLVCWICWDDKKAFINELHGTIEKYRI